MPKGESPTTEDIDRKVVCPRCGYDLRGVIQSWDVSSPLLGVCSECGLEFEWAELLSSKIRKPLWNIEYGKRLTIPWRAIGTLIKAIRPDRFWASLKMTHPPRWRRIILLFLLMFGPLYLAISITHGVYAWRLWSEMNQTFFSYNAQLAGEIARRQAFNAKQAQIPPGARAFGLTAPAPILPSLVNPVHPVLYVGQFVMLPFSDKSLWPAARVARFSTIWNPGTWDELPSPRAVMLARFRWPNDARSLIKIVMYAMLLHVMMPLGFVLVPASRRIARVRWAHVIRIAAYSFMLLWIPLLTMLFSLPKGNTVWPLEYQRMLGWLGLTCFVVTPVALFIWWRYAIGNYLKMPHARGLSASVLVMSMLLLMLCGYFSFCLNMWPGLYLRITGQY